MINRIPDYLKLFVEEEPEIVVPTATVSELTRFCNIFPEVTGLKLEVEESHSEDQLTFPWSSAPIVSHRVTISPTSRSKTSSLADTREFEDSLAALLNLLVDTQSQLSRREAELAAAVPIVSVEEDGEHLSERLHFVLRATTELLNCSAAGLYMLDESTTSLKLRSAFGLDSQAFLSPPRRLEEAVADIEALAGNAVVIEDTESRPHWRVPEKCKAAMCVPVSSSTTILGTLWMFRDHIADFTPNEQNLAEITSGRIAADLERAILTQEVRSLRNRVKNDLPSLHSDSVAAEKRAANEWCEGRLARLAPFVEGWEIAEGLTKFGQSGAFCNWHFGAQDRLHLGVGAAHSATNRELSSIAFQSTHSAHMQHDPKLKELFSQTNQTLWTSSIEGDESSLLHAVLDPSCGRLDYAIAGGVFGYILRPHAWEPLLPSKNHLGVDCELDVTTHTQMLMPGDILLSISNPSPIRNADDNSRMNKIAERLLRNTHLSASELSELAVKQLQDLAVSDDGLAVLVAKRCEQ